MCGRPLHEEPTAAAGDAEDVRQVLPKQTILLPAISFGNPDALRSAYVAALIAALLVHVPFLNLLCFIWYPAAGFLSVYTFRKRTGQTPAVRSGAKLGWITGVLTFAISLLLGAIGSLLPSDDGGLGEAFRRQIEQTPAQDDVKKMLLELLQNPFAVALLVLVVLVISFAATIGLTSAGGALGAKVLEED